MDNIGFLIDEFGSSQLCYNTIISTENIENSIIFYDTLSLSCIQPRVPTMSISEAYSQTGIIVATSIKTAKQMMHFIRAKKRFFYVWDTTWLYSDNQISLSKIFRQFEIIARGEDIAILIENNFNVKVKHITDNFKNIEEIVRNG